MTVGSAGSVNLDYTRALTRKESDLPAYRITAEGCAAVTRASASATGAAMRFARWHWHFMRWHRRGT